MSRGENVSLSTNILISSFNTSNTERLCHTRINLRLKILRLKNAIFLNN